MPVELPQTLSDDLPDPAWSDRLTHAAEVDRADAFDPRDDLARGRARLVRRRVLVGTGSLLAGAVVLGTALLATTGEQVRGTVPGPAATGAVSPTPTFQEPAVTLEPSPSADLESMPEVTVGPGTDLDKYGLPRAKASTAWRNKVFDITASVLDPTEASLNYDSRSYQDTRGKSGYLAMGITMGWTVAGEPGEGMVQVEISNRREPAPAEVGEVADHLGAPLRARTLADGETVEVGRRADGAFAVSYRQPDGELVWALVDPIFANNSSEPVADMAVTELDVIRLVQDERLNLPPL